MANTNTKSVSDSILELTKSAPSISDSVSSVSDAASDASTAVTETGSGFFGFISSISWFTWIIIFIILSLLGFNIFYYLAEGTQEVSIFFAPLLQKFFGITIGTASQTIDVAAEGGKAVVTGAATSVNTGLTAVQNVTPNNAKSSVTSQSLESEVNEDIEEAKNSLEKALSQTESKKKDNDYEPHEASSSVHHTGKKGWCFIGEDRGYRTCSKVNENDKCMSGDIFPTQELCINPNLRT
jgi:hypothetical protein